MPLPLPKDGKSRAGWKLIALGTVSGHGRPLPSDKDVTSVSPGPISFQQGASIVPSK